MEQLVLLLIIGAISLINWLIEQSGKRREQRRFEAERTRREAEASPYLERELTPTPAPETREPAPHSSRHLESPSTKKLLLKASRRKYQHRRPSPKLSLHPLP
jgi:hypothetical protein